jgi:hypothetical protein
MLRGLLKLGLLAGAGWYAYRKLGRKDRSGHGQMEDRFGTTDRPATSGDLTTRLTRLVNQAAEAVRQRTATSADSWRSSGAGFQHMNDASSSERVPREAQAAKLAAMPAVQPNEAFAETAARVARGEAAGTPSR